MFSRYHGFGDVIGVQIVTTSSTLLLTSDVMSSNAFMTWLACGSAELAVQYSLQTQGGTKV